MWLAACRRGTKSTQPLSHTHAHLWNAGCSVVDERLDLEVHGVVARWQLCQVILVHATLGSDGNSVAIAVHDEAEGGGWRGNVDGAAALD